MKAPYSARKTVRPWRARRSVSGVTPLRFLQQLERMVPRIRANPVEDPYHRERLEIEHGHFAECRRVGEGRCGRLRTGLLEPRGELFVPRVARAALHVVAEGDEARPDAHEVSSPGLT